MLNQKMVLAKNGSTEFSHQATDSEKNMVFAPPVFVSDPENGMGELPPLCRGESLFNSLAHKMLGISSILLLCIACVITADVLGRLIFNSPIRGITDLELLTMSAVGFFALAIPVIKRQSMQIDLFYTYFPPKVRRFLHLFSCVISLAIIVVLGILAIRSGLHWTKATDVLEINEAPSIILTGVCMIVTAIAFLFQIAHILKAMISKKELFAILTALILVFGLAVLPFIYKNSGIRFTGLAIGGLGFAVLMLIMLLRVPLGFAMSTIGLLGLLAVARRPNAAFSTVAVIPFKDTATFTMIALPMFMLMGEMVTLAGLSSDLFNAAQKWMGRLPGGLAVATIGGCAGFGAVCGDSMATVITMTSVAMPAMRKNGYDVGLSSGALAAGGTLGILRPPSMGFIVYSMITEESVGKLFIAGVLPGVLLAVIFALIIILRVYQHPNWAPIGPHYSIKEKMISLAMLLPVILLFLTVVIGILDGWFTPAEGGAVGSVMAFLYALARRKVTWKTLQETMYRATSIFGKLFALFIGLYILGAFLAASRLPNLLAESVAALEVNRYLVLLAVIFLYIILGCVMNIIPMMLLTLPSIFPSIQALNFDPIWFGVICVIVMEMGMITPPVGINVFTLASMESDIPMGRIFKGVMPFFFGMILCVALIVLFPQIALYMVP